MQAGVFGIGIGGAVGAEVEVQSIPLEDYAIIRANEHARMQSVAVFCARSGVLQEEGAFSAFAFS